MSHIVTIKTQLRDANAIAAACQRLKLSAPLQGKAQMYGNQTIEGLFVQLPCGQYPLAINTTSGEVQQDNFGGHWGDLKELDRFLQAYAIEKVRSESRKKGYQVTEQPLADGSVKLQIQEGS
jgi:hypothetical protein